MCIRDRTNPVSGGLGGGAAGVAPAVAAAPLPRPPRPRLAYGRSPRYSPVGTPGSSGVFSRPSYQKSFTAGILPRAGKSNRMIDFLGNMKSLAPSFLMHSTLVGDPSFSAMLGAPRMWQAISPVSYTHLDVYKRQVLRTAWGQAPAYTADSIVNASDYSPGPFAPNSVLSIFGSNLSWYIGEFSASQSTPSAPVALSGVEVYVDNWPAPLLYVSPTQINFLVPSGESPGSISVHVVREGASGPFVSLTLVNGAPALFGGGSGFAIATHADGTLLTDASPGQPGEIVVVYATGPVSYTHLDVYKRQPI